MPKQRNYLKEVEKQTQKQQLSKARKKTRPNLSPDKPRQRNWEQFQEEEWDLEGFYEDERIMPKGHSERRKEVSQIVKTMPSDRSGEDDAVESDAAQDVGLHGTVVEVTSGQCKVAVNGSKVDCSLRGALLTQETGYTNVVAVGDVVSIHLEADGRGVVEEVRPRRSVLARTAASFAGHASGQRQIVAANVDRILIVASWRLPKFWPELVDRYLITAERNQLDAVICVNKIDLIEDQKDFEQTLKPYRDLGFMVLTTSAEKSIGITNLREFLTGSITVLAGMSGVGKSSLLSAVQPGLNLKSLEVGSRGKNKNQGRHSTRMATYYPIKEGGAVIDTPGIRDFGLAGLERIEVKNYYSEFSTLSAECSFRDCLHLHEPDCAVRSAAGNGAVSLLRYENYTKIMDSMAS